MAQTRSDFDAFVSNYRRNDYHDAVCPRCGHEGFDESGYVSDDYSDADDAVFETREIKCNHCGFKAEMQTRYEITARQIVWTEED